MSASYPPGAPRPGAPRPGGPGPGGGMPPVKNYLVESIICLVCCGGLLAIPAIIFASQVNGKLAAGDYQGAVQASKNAKMWCIISVCVGLTCGLISAAIQIVAIMAQNA